MRSLGNYVEHTLSVSDTLSSRRPPAVRLMRLRRGETVLPPRTPPAQTPSLPLGVSDHLRRPRDALRLFRPFPPAEDSRSRLAAGAQIITGQKLIAYSAHTAVRPIR